MNKLKSHTRNQRRMYRIHKQEEKIHDLELLVGFLQQENQKYKEVIGNIYSLLNDYEMQNDDVISSYCREIRNVMKGVE